MSGERDDQQAVVKQSTPLMVSEIPHPTGWMLWFSQYGGDRQLQSILIMYIVICCIMSAPGTSAPVPYDSERLSVIVIVSNILAQLANILTLVNSMRLVTRVQRMVLPSESPLDQEQRLQCRSVLDRFRLIEGCFLSFLAFKFFSILAVTFALESLKAKAVSGIMMAVELPCYIYMLYLSRKDVLF